MEKQCNCGGHGHHEHGEHGGCCGGHGHHHGEHQGCCGGHGHHHGEHEHGGCGCGGHGHHHGEHEHGGCGCGGHGHHHHGEDSYAERKAEIVSAPATAAQRDFLRNFAPIAPLPIANYLVKSSKEDAFENIALRDVCLRSAEDSVETIKETAAFLQALEASNLIAIDYDTPLADESYAHYAHSASFLLLQDTVAQGAAQNNFLGDIADLEKGCIAMTAWGKEQIAE